LYTVSQPNLQITELNPGGFPPGGLPLLTLPKLTPWGLGVPGFSSPLRHFSLSLSFFQELLTCSCSVFFFFLIFHSTETKHFLKVRPQRVWIFSPDVLRIGVRTRSNLCPSRKGGFRFFTNRICFSFFRFLYCSPLFLVALWSNSVLPPSLPLGERKCLHGFAFGFPALPTLNLVP